ncbi:outer dense fiber protein 2-like isoform X1 [Girardinichthys multiradiatus]|uniref:outer dense fiber protein 2-like isoform X1 n=1 Tax=Girardinichthys multiradiatus TaxID=208333 RepID=UPI001FAC2BFA|nr:outer dense fiber protein 2-like isoform X1 [Girardinichthys multiradiatus]XP_047237576.1 outer dense fiber protein 2-like isoform X1 [Girardinichthys multiradiatus]
MKTRGSPPAPPPIHVHVAESTPVHVHMRRSPSKTPQGKDALARGNGSRPKIRTPWIPPGRISCRRDLDSYKSQTSRMQLQSDSGIRNQRDAEEQDEELHGASKNISALLREHGSPCCSKISESRDRQRDTDVLLRALIEAEIDGVAVANQLTALKETTDNLTKEKRLSKLHAASLGRQQDLLLEKIEMFDRTNHSLRDLLRDWSTYERESLVWSTERDALKQRLADSEAESMRLFTELSNKEKEASKLAEHLDFEKDNVRTTEELSRILESTRSCLESQLNQAEVEKVQLASQIQRMQQSQDQQREELQVLQGELQTLRQQKKEEEEEREEEQESHALITQRAQRAEESSRQLAEKLQEKETQLSQALSTSSDWCLRHSKEAAGKRQLEEEISLLKLKITELNSRLRSTEEKSRAEREELRNQLHQLSAESASTKLENQTLRRELTSSEEKFRGLHSEARQLKSSIKKSEILVEKYKKKVQQARLESEEYCLKLEITQKEARELRVNLEKEKEKEQVRRELLARIQELEAMPEKLRRTEQQLRDAQEEADVQERRNMEHHAALSDVRHKVEQQGAQLETFQQRNLLLQEENNVLKEKMTNLERKLEDMDAENREMSQTLSLKEGSICSLQQQLEEKTHECSVVSRQLQQTLDDAQRQVDASMQRVLGKEKASQSRALELQNQLSRAKSELSQLQRSKEDMERRFQTQLQNMKERLDQSDSTNRSLQNYVQFLKTSYGNVFGDSLLAS